MIATTVEQSKHLLELGIPEESADMFWLITNEPRLHALTEPLSKYSNWENYPAWSLSALLDFLPEKIEPFYYISLEKYEKGYRIAYLYTIGGELQHLIQYIGETAIDVAYDMVCTILENKLKRNE